MALGWWQRVFSGEPRRLSEVRQYVGELVADCPERHSIIACVAELAANAIEHTHSGRGGTFVVHVQRASRAVRVAVVDAGAPTWPVVRAVRDGDLCESGRGLAIVADLSDRMGIEGEGRSRTVWAEFHHLAKEQPGRDLSAGDGSPSLVRLGTWLDSWACWFGDHTPRWWAVPRRSDPPPITAPPGGMPHGRDRDQRAEPYVGRRGPSRRSPYG